MQAERSKCASATGVDNPLGDPLMVETSDLGVQSAFSIMQHHRSTDRM